MFHRRVGREFFELPKINELCDKDLSSPLSTLQAFLCPTVDMLTYFANENLMTLRFNYEGNKKNKFHPVTPDEMFQFIIFNSAFMAYKEGYLKIYVIEAFKFF